MGYLELIFEIKDGTLLNKIESTDLLRQSYNSDRTGFNVTTKPFEPSKEHPGLDRCYVSPDYQAYFGDFEFREIKLEKYGPASVFVMEIKLEEEYYRKRIKLLEESLKGLEKKFPGSLRSLVYIGLMKNPPGLINEGDAKDSIEPLLKS